MRVLGISSFMRLRQRSSVLLPQPEGPMKAVTSLGRICSEMSFSASLSPYQKYRLRTSILGRTRAASLSRLNSNDSAVGTFSVGET